MSKKNDRLDNKVMMELIPLDILNEIGKVYTAGAVKYGPNQWQGLENGYERYKGALLRHLIANDQEDIDSDTECYHLAQVAWNAMSMLYLNLHKNEKKNNC